MSTLTEVKPITSKSSRGLTPAALRGAMENRTQEDCSDDDNDSSVTEIRQDVPADERSLNGFRDVEVIRQELEIMTEKCANAETHLQVTVHDLNREKAEKAILVIKLHDVNEDLTKAQSQIVSLQERLSALYSQQARQQIPDGMNYPPGYEYLPNGRNMDTSPQPSDNGSTRGLPPTSQRKGRPVFAGDQGYEDPGPWAGDRRASNQRFSGMDGSAPYRGPNSIDGYSLTSGSGNGVYRDKDAAIVRKLSDWMIKSANIVPSRAASYASQLVQKGQASTKRLAKSVRKDPDFLVEMGIDEGDADEICESLLKEFQTVLSGDQHPLALNPALQVPPQVQVPSQPFYQAQQAPLHGSPYPSHTQHYTTSASAPYPPHYIFPHPITDRAGSMSPPHAQGIATQGRKHLHSSESASVRSFSSVPADWLSDQNSPDKVFRDARLSRLESQAQKAAQLAQAASEDAERVAKSYGKSYSRSNSGASGNGHVSSKKLVAQAHEKGTFHPLPSHSSLFSQPFSLLVFCSGSRCCLSRLGSEQPVQ
jgi:hypothetical protein